MALAAVNGLLAKLAADEDLHDDLKQPQVQVVSMWAAAGGSSRFDRSSSEEDTGAAMRLCTTPFRCFPPA